MFVVVSRRVRRLQIRSWGSAFGAETMQSIFLRLLMKPEAGVALLALRCLLGFKLPYLTAYKEALERLAGDKTYVRFGSLTHSHRPCACTRLGTVFVASNILTALCVAWVWTWRRVAGTGTRC